MLDSPLSYKCLIYSYRMVEMYCHMNQSKTTVQYFAILHAVMETCESGNTSTLTLIQRNKHRSKMRQYLLSCDSLSLCGVTRNFSHTIKLNSYCKDTTKYWLCAVLKENLQARLKQKSQLFCKRFLF